MSPTVGRIVHLSVSGRRVPAMVTFVNEDGQPSVHAMDGSGLDVYHATYHEESAESAAKPNQMDTPNYTWAWPPRAA